MTVSPGKFHMYLGRALDFTSHGECKISMFEYVEDILSTFHKAELKGAGTKISAAPADLYKIDEDYKKLGEVKHERFHHLVAKTLFATK